MSTKFCVVAMRGNLDDFMQMIDFARVPEERIGSMNSPTVLVATFISKFSMFELEDLFKSVEEVNFFLMEIDKSGIHIDKENVRFSLMSVFEEFDRRREEEEKTNKLIPLEIKVVKKPPEEIEKDYPAIYQGVEDEYKSLLKKMSKKEKENMVNEILEKMPEIDSRDKALLEIISKHL